jgi:hypothetical protein
MQGEMDGEYGYAKKRNLALGNNGAVAVTALGTALGMTPKPTVFAPRLVNWNIHGWWPQKDTNLGI